MKRFVRGNKHYVQQVIHRVSEIEFTTLSVQSMEKSNSRKYLVWNNLYLSSATGDNCFVTKDNQIVIITSVVERVDGVQLTCKAFKNRRGLKHYPCKSEKLGIFRLENRFSNEFQCTLEDFSGKYVVLATKQTCSKFIAFPLL